MSTKAIYRISSLDGLRGISILLVIIDHAFKSNFKNLKIWILSMDITSNIHKICLEFPKNEIYWKTYHHSTA